LFIVLEFGFGFNVGDLFNFDGFVVINLDGVVAASDGSAGMDGAAVSNGGPGMVGAPASGC